MIAAATIPSRSDFHAGFGEEVQEEIHLRESVCEEIGVDEGGVSRSHGFPLSRE
jgi:hypothetical protein